MRHCSHAAYDIFCVEAALPRAPALQVAQSMRANLVAYAAVRRQWSLADCGAARRRAETRLTCTTDTWKVWPFARGLAGLRHR
jgi:hypothetical protein